MRTIKFKGKCTAPEFSGKTVCGSLLQFPDGTVRILVHNRDKVFDYFTVAPQSVCQFTGFFDKNGREIYEGDILRSDKYPFSSIGEGIYERDNYYGIVCWGEIEASFYMAALKNPDSEVSGVSDGICNPISQKNLQHFEVVGTVHSPEWQRKLDLKDE
jgi:uncharacterized phage protein (TIGR01671 family)